MGIDVDFIATYAKTLPTLLSFDQRKVSQALHLLGTAYHPTFHQLVQLSRHPPTLALVKVSTKGDGSKRGVTYQY